MDCNVYTTIVSELNGMSLNYCGQSSMTLFYCCTRLSSLYRSKSGLSYSPSLDNHWMRLRIAVLSVNWVIAHTKWRFKNVVPRLYTRFWLGAVQTAPKGLSRVSFLGPLNFLTPLRFSGYRTRPTCSAETAVSGHTGLHCCKDCMRKLVRGPLLVGLYQWH